MHEVGREHHAEHSHERGIDDSWRECDVEALRDHFLSDEQQRDETRERGALHLLSGRDPEKNTPRESARPGEFFCSEYEHDVGVAPDVHRRKDMLRPGGVDRSTPLHDASVVGQSALVDVR